MADTGAPGYIPLFGDSDPVTPIQAPLNAHATALNTAILNSGFAKYTTVASLPTTATVGSHATVYADSALLNGDYYFNGTAWSFMGKQFLVFGPGGPINTPTSGSATWFTVGNLTVPAGCYSALINLELNYVVAPSTSLNVSVGMTLGGVAGGINFRPPASGTGNSFSFSWTDRIVSPPAGTQPLAVKATFSSGSGSYTVTAGSLVTATAEIR